MKVSTVRPSAIEIGMPVSISAISSANMISARRPCGSTIRPLACATQIATISSGDQDEDQAERAASRARASAGCERRRDAARRRHVLDALDVGDVVVRQLAGPVERTRRPAGSGSTSGRSRAGSPDRRSTSALRDRSTAGRCAHICQTKAPPNDRDDAGEQRAAQQAEHDHALARAPAAAC